MTEQEYTPMHHVKYPGDTKWREVIDKAAREQLEWMQEFADQLPGNMQTVEEQSNAALEANNAAQTAMQTAVEAKDTAVSQASTASNASRIATSASSNAMLYAQSAEDAERAASASASTAASSAENAAQSAADAAAAVANLATKSAEAVKAITDQQSASEQAIEAKTNEQAARIPEVTAMANEVSALKGDLGALDSRLSESIVEISDNLSLLENKAGKTFSLSDKDGLYYFLPFKMVSGKEYHIKSTKPASCYLRAEKYVTPSIQTVGGVYANTDVAFTTVSDLNWVVLSTTLTSDQTFTVELWDENDKISIIDKTLQNHENKIDTIFSNIKIPTEIHTGWKQGNLSTGADGSGCTIQNSTTRITTNRRIPTSGASKLGFSCPDGFKYRVRFFEASGDLLSGTSYITVESGIDDALIWHTDSRLINVPYNAGGFAVSLSYEDNRDIQATENNGFSITIDALYSKIDDLDLRVNVLESKIENEYKGKKISILGDSISTFSGYSYEGNRCRYPQSDLLTNVNDTYWMRLINEFGMILGINEAWAGSRVSWDGTTEGQDVGANKHIASENRIGHLGENGTPDIILVNGGTNDIGASVSIGTFNYESPMNYTDEQIANLPVATFADAYRTMLIRLQKKYPTSKILVLLPNYTTSYYTPQKADEYCEVIKEACDYFGVKWKDMRASGITIFNRASYLPDGIHYNANGMAMIEKNIKKFMLNDFTV